MFELTALTREAIEICIMTKNDKVLGQYFTHDNPWARRPWKEFNYWNGWYALAKLRQPRRILEVGTGYGFSTIALARGAGERLELLVSLDLGIWGSDLKEPFDNLPYVQEGIERYRQERALDFVYHQFEVDTQDGWWEHEALVALMNDTVFDLVLIDGCHEHDGLYNDLVSFWSYGAQDSLFICDDLQHKDPYRSFSRFVCERRIDRSMIWRFLTSTGLYGGSRRRDQGLLLNRWGGRDN